MKKMPSCSEKLLSCTKKLLSFMCVAALVSFLANVGCGDDAAVSAGDAGGADGAMDADTVTDGSADAAPDGLLDADGPGFLELALYPEMDPINAYSGGPSLIVAQVTAPAELPVALSVSVEPEIAAEVVPEQMLGGGVAEIFLRPTELEVGKAFVIELRAEGGDLVETATVEGQVIDWQEDSPEYPDSLLMVFMEHIALNYPELGLGPQTTWIESWSPQPQILVVGHRAYLDETYQVHLAWHVTIAPHDWAYVTLRHRSTIAPDMAFCFPSQSEDRTVQEADLDDPRLPCAQ